MRNGDLKRLLVAVPAPDEAGAERRAWRVVRRAFAEREPLPPQRFGRRNVLALAGAALVLAAAAAVVSPTGRAVLGSLRDAIGREPAPAPQPALFSLPSSGRLLVVSERGVWVVRADGSKRLLGRYREAAWSPHGRFVVAARANELAALDPFSGTVRWTLSRPAVGNVAWGGDERDTRVAYTSAGSLRVVAGDGSDDRLLARRSAPVAPAWRPGSGHVLVHATPAGVVRAVDADRRRVLWTGRGVPELRRLEWSADGARLLVQGRRSLLVLGSGGRRLELLGPGAAPVVAAAPAPRAPALAFVQRSGDRSDLWVVPRLRPDGSAARRVFSAYGRFSDVRWSPDGRWLLVAWRDADQWLFLRSAGPRRIRSVSSISAQFRAERFPSVEGWCCG